MFMRDMSCSNVGRLDDGVGERRLDARTEDHHASQATAVVASGASFSACLAGPAAVMVYGYGYGFKLGLHQSPTSLPLV